MGLQSAPVVEQTVLYNIYVKIFRTLISKLFPTNRSVHTYALLYILEEHKEKRKKEKFQH